MKWVSDKKGNLVCGDYVLTRVNNAFNEKESYWISKKGCIYAFYCFTFQDPEDYWKKISHPEDWIQYFEDMTSSMR